ncbi:MAG: trua3 [Chlamydiia bacterium]|nr:trua3 [Chlamydiia bacterium]
MQKHSQLHKNTSKNIVLVVAYDGTHYYGWQKTGTKPSIEETLQIALEKILQHPIKLQAASRTDRGVHADSQIVNLFTSKSIEPAKLKRSLNQLLPSDIRVLTAHEAISYEFHPTLDAKSKEYHYNIVYEKELMPHLRHTHWHIPDLLDLQAMQKASSIFIGTNDFRSFCNQRKNLEYEHTIRSLSSLKIVELDQEKRLRIELIGNNFLYKMARNIVGTLVYVGQQKIALDALPAILESKKRIYAGITAPAQGLTLHKVNY